jgi:segregation and condensation protein B
LQILRREGRLPDRRRKVLEPVDTEDKSDCGPNGEGDGVVELARPPALRTAERPHTPEQVLKAQVEAVLFVSTRPVSTGALARLLDREPRQVRDAITALETDCADRGVTVVEVAGGWQFRTRPEHADLLRTYLQAKPGRLTRAALETLSLVAYKQPVTRAEVEDVRGVDSGAVLKGLLERHLIRILGKKEEPGRPLLYGTAPTFLEVFGLRSLRELPTLREFVELTEEHQRIVERDAPDPEQARARALGDYLEDMSGMDAAEVEAEVEADLEAHADEDRAPVDHLPDDAADIDADFDDEAGDDTPAA